MNLSEIISNIRSTYGDDALIKMSDPSLPVKRFSSGKVAIDSILGGGWPLGRIIEIFGNESSGKTTIALHAIASLQATGQKAAIIDVEHAIDPDYARMLGVNMDEVYISQPSSGEEAISIALKLSQARDLGLIVVDSIAALTTKAQLEGEVGDANIAAVARMLSQNVKKLATSCSVHETTLIFTNQIREKPGQMFGNPEYEPGGRAVKFYSSIRMKVFRRSAPNEENGEAVSSTTVAKVIKNKCSPPFKDAEFEIAFGKGVNDVKWAFEYSVKNGLVKRKGSQYTINDAILGRGKEEAVKTFEEKFYKSVCKAILKRECKIS